MTLFKKSQLFGLNRSQRRNYYVHPGSLQKTNVIFEPVSTSRTRCYRQTNSLYSYPKCIHKRTLNGKAAFLTTTVLVNRLIHMRRSCQVLIDAVTVEVKSPKNQMSGFATYRALACKYRKS